MDHIFLSFIEQGYDYIEDKKKQLNFFLKH